MVDGGWLLAAGGLVKDWRRVAGEHGGHRGVENSNDSDSRDTLDRSTFIYLARSRLGLGYLPLPAGMSGKLDGWNTLV